MAGYSKKSGAKIRFVNLFVNHISEYFEVVVARHSHATVLKRNGAPLSMIKENLGHSSIATTESYLDDFAD
jgi:site-specific recombinase XerD